MGGGSDWLIISTRLDSEVSSQSSVISSGLLLVVLPSIYVAVLMAQLVRALAHWPGRLVPGRVHYFDVLAVKC